MKFAWSKNKKGAALIYAVMVLLLLATVIVAMSALSTASYTDAVLAASDDQSYYYAKSIGLAVKEQFIDGYNINRIIAELDRQEADLATYPDPQVNATFTITGEDATPVSGTLQIRYARDAVSSEVNNKVIEVRAACVVNNAVAAVTSLFSCETDSEEESEHLKSTLSDYDVILTDTKNLNFDFTQASEVGTGSSNLSVYVYAGEDDSVDNPEFSLRLDMQGKLTTTGKTKIVSKKPGTSTSKTFHKITGNLTSYGDVTLTYTGVKGIHCDGNVKLSGQSYVVNDIYARGTVTIEDPGEQLNTSFVMSLVGGGGGIIRAGENAEGHHSAHDIYAMGAVQVKAQAWVTGSIYTHGNVTVTGKGAAPVGAGWWTYDDNNHRGNTLVDGSIYSEGDVTITKGAIVVGDVYANGSVTVEKGACVVGKVQSLNGGVTVNNAVVGGQVNCPNGTLTLNNGTNNTYTNYLAEADNVYWNETMGTYFGGTIIHGGIGCFHADYTTCLHTCNKLKTSDTDNISVIWGKIYVANAYKNGFTPLLSVWIQGSIYLENSIAAFKPEGTKDRTYYGKNTAGNPYTYVYELNQKKDLYDKNATAHDKYMNMYGAHIITMNVGSDKSALYDARLENGWVRNVNARCLYLCDVEVEGGAQIYASRYLEIWGSKDNTTWGWTNYKNDEKYTRGFSAPYVYAQEGTVCTTVVPSTARIDVPCYDDSYSGAFSSDLNCGFYMGVNSTVYGEVYVGASDCDDPGYAFVLLGDESRKGPTKFLGKLHAYVGNFMVTKSTYLSTVKDSATSYTAAEIYAEVTGGSNPNYDAVRPEAAKNSFYVEKSNSSSGGYYRWGSKIQVKGNAYVEGHVYNFDHFMRDDGTAFTYTNDARFKGDFQSANKTLNIWGTAIFNKVYATRTDSVTTMTGSLTVSELHLNGSFKMTNVNHTLKVNGDMYVRNMSTAFLSSVEVTGNMRIVTSTSTSALDPSRKFTVTGDLYIGKNNIKLNKSSYDQYVIGTVEMGNGDLTLTGGAYVGGAKTASNKSLIIENGTLKGDFNVGNLSIAAGEIKSSSNYTYIIGNVEGTFTHTGGTLTRVYMTVKGSGQAGDSAPAVWIKGSSSTNIAKGESVFIKAINGGAKVEGGSNVSYKQGGLITKRNTAVAGGFECGISVSDGNLIIGSATQPANSYQVGCSYYPSTDEEGNAVKTDDYYRVLYAKGNIEWLYNDAHAMTKKDKYGGWTHLTADGYVKMGDATHYIGGRFDQICSKNQYVNFFVAEVGAVVAKGTSYVHTSKAFGSSSGSGNGAKITNGDLYIYGQTGRKDTNRGVANTEQIGEYIRGYFQVSGYIHIETQINANGASFGCKDVYGLNLIHKYNHLLDISLSLSAPPMSGGYYVLQYPISGKFTLNRDGNLRYGGNDADGDPLTIKGEIYVNGIVEFNGSTVDLECWGGLHCLNDKVTIRSDFGGNVDLPNVTTLVMNADIGVKAPRVTSFEVSMETLSHSLNLTGCDSLKINAGTTIKGSVIISSTGKVVNNGTVNESVKCGVYEGSGIIKKDLITQKSGAENKITGSGYVTGNIWSTGKLTINSTGTFGKSGSYIYAAADISIKNATFTSSMDYIFTDKGNIHLENCLSIPKVYNTKGYIRFWNDSSHQTTIASVLSHGTYIDFGDNDNNGNKTYQTVKGTLEWGGSYSGNAVDFRNGEHTVVEGVTRIIGTGNVALRKATLSTLHLFNDGKVTSTGGGSITANLYIGAPVTEVTINKTVKGDVTCSASASKPDVTLSEVDGTLKASGCNSLTVNGELKKSPTFKAAGTVTLKKKVSGTIYCYNSNLYVEGNVDGAVNAFAPDFSSASDMKVVALGTQLSMITVNGDIKVHGRLIDNSQQLGTGRKIYCKGAYYADLQKEFNDGNSENGKGCTQFNFTSQADGRCYILGSKSDNYTVYNTVFNIDGHLSIYTFYNESTGKYYQMTFNKDVTCKSLIVNSNCPNTTSSTATTSGAPTRKIGFYGKSDNNGDKAKGLDKKCWFEDFETYNKLDIYYTNDTYSGACANRDRMYFKGKVNVKGVCIASHTKFGSQLNTEGQVSLAYCLLYSAGYSSDTNHSNYSSNDNGIKVADDGAFLHTLSSNGGENYFNYVATFSNVAVYNGISHIFGGSVFKGTTYSGSSDEVSYKGHRSTKLFYFGASVELYGASSIYSAKQGSSYLAAGRTIVWVKTGALVVRDNSYIGDKAYKKGDTLETKDYSQHPGVFVSDTGTGTVSIGGTNYNRGSVYVKGKDSTHPSSITLDICACREIRTTNYGVVVSKCGSGDWQQYAGLYLTKGSLVEESNGWIQVWHDTSDRYGERHYWTGVSDSSAYQPNGSKYLSYFNTKWDTYKKNIFGARYDTHTKTYSQTKDQLTQCYTPKSSAPSVASPNGVEIDSTTSKNMTYSFPSTQITATKPSITEKPSAPSAPTISASGGFNTQGDASVSAFIVEHETDLDTEWAYAIKTSTVSTASVAAANASLAFSGSKSRKAPYVWSYPVYTPNKDKTTVKRPSSVWTSSISEHFDKTNETYWNTRYIPYVWKLPYEGTTTSGYSGATPAKRVLQGYTNDAKKMNGEFDLTGWTQDEAEGKAYYVNANHYTGSNLEKKASDIVGWRSSDTNKLYDYVGVNCKYDPDRHSNSVAAYYYLHGDPDSYRRSKLFIFESGELPYSAFYMDQGKDKCTNFGDASKKIRDQDQVGWYWGSSNMSYYDISMVFYTCVDPLHPYTSAAKDIHVVLPQGIALRFYGGQSDYPLTNTVTVVGNGRVFLYLTSGDTIYFKSNAVYESETGALWWKNTTYKSIYANPVGGMKKNGNMYEPLLYIIGAGTNIDLIIEDMPLAAAVYMPFGSKTEVYGYSSGSLKKYNTFKNATGGNYSSPYSGNGQTTAVARNRLKLVWNEASHVGLPRWIYGPIVTDNFDYSSASSSYHLNFKNEKVQVNLSDTTIYAQSTTSSKTNGGKTYPIATFLSAEDAPGYSTAYLNWSYSGIKVEG